LGDAMPLLRRAAHVEAVTIAAHGSSDDAAQFDLRGHLARHDVVCEMARVEARGRKAEPLLARAQEIGAELIVVGASRHSVWRQAVLGDTMRDITHETRVPLVLSG